MQYFFMLLLMTFEYVVHVYQYKELDGLFPWLKANWKGNRKGLDITLSNKPARKTDDVN